MKTLEQLCEPFNFSTTRCYVIVLKILSGKYMRIEHKLPRNIRHLKGIYISVSLTGKDAVGRISLNFNGQSLKAYHNAAYRADSFDDNSHPYPFDEKIKPNTFLQGYFISHNVDVSEYPYTVSLYLHYKP